MTTTTATRLQQVRACELELGAARLHWYASLPPFPADGICPNCGSNDWLCEEQGYVCFTHGEWEDGVLQLWTPDWDDMSEGGDFEYVACGSCGTSAFGTSAFGRGGFICQLPDEREWH